MESEKIKIKLAKVFDPKLEYEGSGLSKEQEITILEFLYENDTYFAESLNNSDMMLIAKNIKDDFPIFSGNLSIFFEYKKEIEALKSHVKEAENEIKNILEERQVFKEKNEELNQAVESLQEIESNYYDLTKDQQEKINSITKEIIKLKLKNGEELLQEEKELLINSL